MSFGRDKKKSSETVKVQKPKITRYEYNSVTGDQYITRRTKNREISEAILSPTTRRTVQTSQQGMQAMLDELVAPDSARVAEIQKRSQDFYDLQAKTIHSESDRQLSQVRSDIASRFGGTYNATFGNDLLARLEQNRQDQLYTAGKESALIGEDLYRQDEQSRINRFTLFNNYINDLNGVSSNSSSLGSQVLSGQDQLALSRTRLLQSIAADKNQYEYETKRQQAAMAMQMAIMASKTFAGG